MIRVAITGPESTGKTTLAKAISEKLNGEYIPEFAREYLAELKGKYKQSDLNEIARRQLGSLLNSSARLRISDTDFIVLDIWSNEKYGSTSSYIEDLIINKYFDLHILCTPDIPWEEDPLRENPNDRDRLFDLYKTRLIELKKPFIIVEGSHEERLKKSCEAIGTISL